MARAAIVLFLMLAACGQEKDFDTRFEETEQSLRDKAADIEADLEARQEDSREAAGGVAEKDSAH